MLAASLLVTNSPSAAQDADDDVLLPTKTDDQNEPFVLEYVDVDLSNYDVDPLAFDLERTTFTEIGWMRDRLERSVTKAVVREAFAIADLNHARSELADRRAELQAANIHLGNLAETFSSAAVAGFLRNHTGGLDDLLAPDLETFAATSLSVATTDEILRRRGEAEIAVGEAQENVASAEAVVADAELARRDAALLVSEAEGVVQVFEVRVLEHAEIDEAKDEAARALGNSFAAREPAAGQLVVNADVELTSVAGVFKVNVQIEEQLDALIAHARADGLEFGGGSYRTVESQIELRIAHCGGASPDDVDPDASDEGADGGMIADDSTAADAVPVEPAPVDPVDADPDSTEADSSPDGTPPASAAFAESPEEAAAREARAAAYRHWVIYEAPASSCSPPTAKPGQSEHQLGLAIDFSDSSGSILTWGSPEFAWLEQNAHLYGLINLPSEAWHWSTTGS